jgi:hypothetical protein
VESLEPRSNWNMWKMGNKEVDRLGYFYPMLHVRLQTSCRCQIHPHANSCSISTGILLAFMIPRVPAIYVDNSTPLTPTTNTDSPDPTFGKFPATFAFNASLSMKVDTGSNFLPLKFNNMHAEISDLGTSQLIATGDLGPYSLAAKTYSQVYLPLTVNYTAANMSDPTWANVYNACRNTNQYPGGVRPGE